MDKQTAIAITGRWLDRMVIGLNLCPFAKRVVDDKSLRLTVSHAVKDEAVAEAVLMELETLHNSSEQDVATGLLIFSHGLKNFDHYLSLLDQAQQLLEQVGLEGIFQIASFHPDYTFAGVDESDLGNYTNRSPLPMLHFIREAQLERVLENYPHPEAIPENNIDTLNTLGREAVRRLYDSLQTS
jgi:hypothetical protein